jgi:hypothetical protein
MRVGRLSEILNLRTVIFGTIVVLSVVAILGYRAWMNTSMECVNCHSDRKKMEELNAPWAYVTDEMVQEESHHPHIQCRDCHLGNGRARNKDRAHSDMLKMLIVSEEGRLLDRKSGYPYGLSKTGDDRLLEFLPKVFKDNEWQFLDVRNILWHDRNPETFDFDPKIVEKTCGKSGCHPEALKQFKTSIMARNYRQRTMRTWLIPYGPHNCGPSFADQPPIEIQKSSAFNFSNTRKIMEEINIPFSIEHAKDKQRFCNVCHAGCLDCHYTPKLNKSVPPYPPSIPPLLRGERGGVKGERGDYKSGVHSFSRIPPSESCMGFGRGNTMCHSGSMHSRRGETYIGGDYSVPDGMSPDVHYKKGLGCVECHPTGERGMGHIERKAGCQYCHLEVIDAHSKDIHSKMDCATCHIKELRGYQITVWGPGGVAGRRNPFKKYLYYGIQSPPILIKDRKGIWMPVKIWPHSLGNVKVDLSPSKTIQFRWPDGEPRDAYYVVGTFNIQDTGSKTSSKQLLWLEIEQAAHPFGPARDCSSCHASQKQVSKSKWEYLDEGAEPFTGEYRIAADEKGLRIEDLRVTSPVKILQGYKVVDFAPWLYLRDEWKMPGDFSINTDPEKYRKYYKLSKKVKERIETLDVRSRSFVKKTRQRYKELRGLALHNPSDGLRRIEVEFSP